MTVARFLHVVQLFVEEGQLNTGPTELGLGSLKGGVLGVEDVVDEDLTLFEGEVVVLIAISTGNIKAVRGSLWSISVNKLSQIPKLQSVSVVYKNQ